MNALHGARLSAWFGHGRAIQFHSRAAAGLLLTALLPGCASLSRDGGLAAVNDITRPALAMDAAAHRTPEEADAARARIAALLRRPLSADSAVQIALLNNRGLQAAYNALGLSEAAMVQASLPPNPTVSLSRMAGGGALEVESRLVGSLVALATLPVRADIAADRFRQAQMMAAAETLRVASEARRAFYRAVAAQALAGFLAQARETGETAATLAKRLGETGAMNKLDQARNQVFLAELVTQLRLARQRATSERERLMRVLGLGGDDLVFTLPAQLPPLPARPRSLGRVEVEALYRRVDLQIARIEVDLLAKSYGLTQATRFINLLDVAGISKSTREGGETVRERGIEVELQVPLFDFGAVRMKQAEESYLQAVNLLAARAVSVRSEARDAYQTYRSAYDVAQQYRREVLPLRKIISEEILLRYNAMQIDVFALLVDARQRIGATGAAIEAERDFWLAETNLGAALLSGNAASSDPAVSTAAPAEGPGGH